MRMPWQKKPRTVQTMMGQTSTGQPLNMTFNQAPEPKVQKTPQSDMHEMLEENVSFDDAFRFMREKWGVGYMSFHKAWYKMKKEARKNDWLI